MSDCPECKKPGVLQQVGSASGRAHLRCENNHVWREKNPAAVALGSKGGKASAKAMSGEDRVARAEKAANARWGKEKHA